MTAHTPAPWSLELGPSEIDIVASADCDVHPVATCEVNLSCRSMEETEANARVMAAAPDMLAALREIVTICTESVGECRKRMGTRVGNSLVAAEAAIRLAETGERVT